MNLIMPGEQLPSVRNMGTALQIDPMTISKGLAQLELVGVLIRKRGVGMLVAQTQTGHEIGTAIEKTLIEFVKQARADNLNDEDIISLVQQHLSLHQEGK